MIQGSQRAIGLVAPVKEHKQLWMAHPTQRRLQIANLETENDLDAIELVRDGIDRRGILMEINLTDLRLSMKRGKESVSSEQLKHKPKTI